MRIQTKPRIFLCLLRYNVAIDNYFFLSATTVQAERVAVLYKEEVLVWQVFFSKIVLLVQLTQGRFKILTLILLLQEASGD